MRQETIQRFIPLCMRAACSVRGYFWYGRDLCMPSLPPGGCNGVKCGAKKGDSDDRGDRTDAIWGSLKRLGLFGVEGRRVLEG